MAEERASDRSDRSEPESTSEKTPKKRTLPQVDPERTIAFRKDVWRAERRKKKVD